MSSARTVENPAGTPIDNSIDTGRKWPSSALADLVATETPAGVRVGSPQVDVIVGPGASATVKLRKPVTSISFIQAYVTATGVAAAVQYKRAGTDYSVNKKDQSNGNVATLTDLSAASHVTETWIVHYYSDDSEGTIGGQSVAARGSTNAPSQ